MLYFLRFSLLSRLCRTANYLNYLLEDNRELTECRKRYNCDDVFNTMCFTSCLVVTSCVAHD